jgi:hypothetical protein
MLTAAKTSRSSLKTQNRPVSESTPPHRSPRIPIVIVLTMLLLFLPASNARGQSTFGSIRGTVTDVSGAVIDGATIRLHSLDENADRETTTNSTGDFLFENLKAGHYKVTFRTPALPMPWFPRLPSKPARSSAFRLRLP